MTIIDQLVYKITGDNSQFDKTLDNSDKQMNKFGGVAKAIFAGVTVAAIGMAIKKVAQISQVLIDSASDAEETRNKFNVTFSGIRDAADATAKNLAANYGLSTQKSQDLLASTGDLLSGFGFTQESALDLSTQVNTLAVDLASFTNFSGGAEGASAALTKGLLGERESMKSLGIAITEADIKQLAEDKGITGTLDRQTKAMLTLELAVSQSKNAIGDFARSSDGYANQVRILDSSMEDLKTTLGNKLLPVATSIIGIMNDVVRALNSDNTAATKLRGSTAQLVSINGKYNDTLETLKTKSGELTESEKARLTVMKEMEQQRLNEALGTLAISYNKTTREIDNQRASVESLKAQDSAYSKVILHHADAQAEYNALYYKKNKTDAENLRMGNLLTALMDTKLQRDTQSLAIGEQLKTQQNELTTAELARADTITALSTAVANGTINIDTYIVTNKALYDEIMNGVKALEIKNRVEKEAIAIYAETTIATKLEADGLVKLYSAQTKTAKTTEDRIKFAKLLSLATADQTRFIEENNAKLAEQAKGTDDLAEKEKARAEILANTTKALADAEAMEVALGDAYDLDAQKSSILLSATEALITSGLAPAEARVQAYVIALGKIPKPAIEATEAITSLYTEVKKASRDLSLDNEIETYLKEQKDAFNESFMEWVNVAGQSLDTIGSMIESFSADSIKEIGSTVESVGQATGNAVVEAAGMIIQVLADVVDFFVSMEQRAEDFENQLTSIAQSANAQRLDNKLETLTAEYDAETAIRDQALLDELERNGFAELSTKDKLDVQLEKAIATGDSEEQAQLETAIAKQVIIDNYTALQLEADEAYATAKRKIDHDTAVLNRDIAVVQAKINESKAISDLGWFNWGKKDDVHGMYAELISSIQAMPIPSYAVGSMRIPETGPSILHKDEIVLPAQTSNQAREEGITIAPTGSGGSGKNITLMVYLDGKVIANNSLGYINDGAVGKISARVVK